MEKEVRLHPFKAIYTSIYFTARERFTAWNCRVHSSSLTSENDRALHNHSLRQEARRLMRWAITCGRRRRLASVDTRVIRSAEEPHRPPIAQLKVLSSNKNAPVSVRRSCCVRYQWDMKYAALLSSDGASRYTWYVWKRSDAPSWAEWAATPVRRNPRTGSSVRSGPASCWSQQQTCFPFLYEHLRPNTARSS